MKSSKFISTLAAACIAALLLTPRAALAQMPGDSTSILNSAIVKLFGNVTGFSAKAEIHVMDKSKKETDFVPLGFAMLDGKTRMEIDVAGLKGAELPPEMLAKLKALGMDTMIVVSRPDTKTTLSIYPKAKAFAEITMTKDEAAAVGVTYELKKTKLGKETVDGHACERNKAVLTGNNGQKVEALLWNAGDLKDFPIKIEITDKEYTVDIKFKDVKLARPDQTQFDAPTGMTKFDSAEALMGARISSYTPPAAK